MINPFDDLSQQLTDIKNLILENQTQINNEKLSVKDVSTELGVAELTVRNWVKSGKLKALNIGRRLFIRRTELNNALKEVKSLKYKR